MNFRINPPCLFPLLGLITGSVFLVTPLSWLTPLLLASLLGRIKDLAVGPLFWGMFQFAFLFFAVHLWWLPVSLGEFFGPMSYLLYVLVLPILSTMWSLTTVLTRWVFEGHFLFFLPFSWMLMEHLRSLGPFQFTWGTLGYAWVNSPVVQVADLGGVPLLSFLTMLLACALADLRKKQGVWLLLLALPMLGGALLYGLVPPGRPEAREKVALVQGNIPPRQKIQRRQQAELEVYLDLSRTLKTRDALVVWPETASPVTVKGDLLSEMLKMQPRWLVGNPRWEGDSYFNSVSAFSSTSSGRYDKRVLVPFGESFPLQGQLSGVYSWVFASLGLPNLRGSPLGNVKPPLGWMGSFTAPTSVTSPPSLNSPDNW
ncbi:apolipoprotein N-acyltransferase [Deinococcus cellulosilyticus]|uniref:CN hydrolase domain-containing protein n=1 Tax=Deinococcus cellulosilyticus (strain DSM 18568 / NBRC 106333 / KACC 11606 / 5516J-15) TaxID=1223518 RepID=A0A511N190_DEIC1|nr:apolipoprotein N-acyltransferase [Deinococcus cellulosilyticus]GEM46644.1 hypothetical protein DC3_22790 [Deinococcus cellulosilyticus NBRC 106333 = KACC 11606]